MSTEKPRGVPPAPVIVADLLGCLLSAVGAAILGWSLDPRWAVVTVVAVVVTALGARPGYGSLVAAAAALAGWATAILRLTFSDHLWTGEELVRWGGALAALLLSGAVVALLHRRLVVLDRALQDARSRAVEATVHDPLTGLANRRGLAMLGAQILESARRRGDAVYCMFIDVDGLARVNNELGHTAGDNVLLTVAQALSSCTRATDAVARWGDDEFVVVGPGTGLPPLEMERRVRARCLEAAPVAREHWPARISAGGSVLEPWDDGDVDSLLRVADREMHLRRALRREAAAPAYRPARVDPSPHPPDPRRPAAWPD